MENENLLPEEEVSILTLTDENGEGEDADFLFGQQVFVFHVVPPGNIILFQIIS